MPYILHGINYIKVLNEYKLEIYHLIHTKSSKWNQNVINYLAMKKFKIFLIYIRHIVYIQMYTKTFVLHMVKTW